MLPKKSEIPSTKLKSEATRLKFQAG